MNITSLVNFSQKDYSVEKIGFGRFLIHTKDGDEFFNPVLLTVDGKVCEGYTPILNQIDVYYIDTKDLNYNLYAQRRDSSGYDGFIRFTTHSGRRIELNKRSVRSMEECKMVFIKYNGKQYFYLLECNDIVVNGIDNALFDDARKVNPLNDYKKIINGY